MARKLAPRVLRSGPYVPSVPRSGSEGDALIFRKNNLITRGRDGRYYEEVYTGEGDRNQDILLEPLTGTVTLTEDSTLVTGSGSAFKSEAKLGQRIVVVDPGNTSWVIVPKQINSDTEMIVWRAPDGSITGATAYRMSRAFALNYRVGTCLSGNAYELDRGSIASAGTGTLRIDGQTLQGSSLVMSTQPKLSLFDPLTGNYTNFTLGMDSPLTAPTAVGVGGGTKGMQAGSYSFVITPARKQTRGFNNPSPRGTVTITSNQKVRITFPAMDTTNGQNAWRVWVTTFAFTQGSDLNYLNGPWFFHSEITDDDVSSAGGTFDFEWLDAEVEANEIVSFNNDPPVEAEFVESLDNKLVYISCQGQGWDAHPEATSPGPFIVPTKPSNIEASPLEFAVSSSPPELILGAVSAQGRLYLLTTNHLQIAMSTGRDDVPIVIRPYWKDGFAAAEQVVFVNGMLYGFTLGGPTRSAGEGDESWAQRDWAADVYEITKDWNPGHVLEGYDPKNNIVCYFHTADHRNAEGFWTTRVLGYGLSQNFWVLDALISSDSSDQIVSGAATVGDRLILIVGGRAVPLVPASGSWALGEFQWTAAGIVSAEASGIWGIPALTWSAEGTSETFGDADWTIP